MLKFDWKKNNDQDTPHHAVDHPPLTLPPAQATDEERGLPGKVQSIIASDLRIEGNLLGEANLQLHGRIIGNINLPNSQVRIMRSGVVKGDIVAKTLLIDGQVDGVCTAEVLEVLEQGKLIGTVRANRFSISKGGRFIGHSEPIDAEEPARPARIAELPAAEGIGAEAEART